MAPASKSEVRRTLLVEDQGLTAPMVGAVRGQAPRLDAVDAARRNSLEFRFRHK
jgi:hypothetical protein